MGNDEGCPKVYKQYQHQYPIYSYHQCDTFSSLTSQSPRMTSFSINLSSDDEGSNLLQRYIGSEKVKIKRMTTERDNSAVDTLISSKEQKLDF